MLHLIMASHQDDPEAGPSGVPLVIGRDPSPTGPLGLYKKRAPTSECFI